MTPPPAPLLRLLRDTSAGLAGRAATPDDAAILAAMTTLLAELIADADAPGDAPATPADELARWSGIDAAALAERQPAPGANAADAPLPHDDLAAFLNRTVAGEGAVQVTASRTVARGNSKKTVLVDLAGNKVLPDRIALRIDRRGNYIETTVTDEFPILQLLWDNGARIPQPFAIEPSGTVIGERFLVVAAAGGAPVGGNYVSPPRDAALIADIAACLARIHATPVDAWPRPDQSQGPACIDAEIAEYRADYDAIGEASPIMEAAFAWIEANKARAYGPAALVHNDFNFNNLLIEGSRVSAVLDWEFAHVGTAAADLCFFYYSAENVSSFAQFLADYAAAGGTVPPKEQLDFYILWGQLRLTVLGFKAVRALEEGASPDVRFGIAKWHRRQGLLRLGALLPQLEQGGIDHP